MISNRPTTLHFEEYEKKRDIHVSEEQFNILKDLKYIKISKRYRKISQDEYKVSITAKSYIGLLRIKPNLQIIIKPKIEADFIAMLRYIEDKKIKVWSKLLELIKKKENFIEFFIESFLKKVNQLLVYNRRRGFDIINKDLIQPKGRILVKKTIRNENKLPKKINCQFFEYSLNTPFNQIIKYTLQYIKPIISSINLNLFRQNFSLLNNVETRKWTSKQIEGLQYHRLNIQYKPIIDFCRLILDDFSLIFEEGQERYFAFVINSWNIYEVFLREIYKKYQSSFKVDPYKIESLTDEIEWNNRMKDRPDLILWRENKIIYLDAKYKLNYKQSDYDQLIRYLTQKITGRQLPYGELIYPKIDVNQEDILKRGNQNVMIRFIDLKRVNEFDYLTEFVNKTVKECNKYLYN